MSKLLESAKEIKDFCANEGLKNEEKCPFFRGYKKENGVNILHTFPCNWDIENHENKIREDI